MSQGLGRGDLAKNQRSEMHQCTADVAAYDIRFTTNVHSGCAGCLASIAPAAAAIAACQVKISFICTFRAHLFVYIADSVVPETILHCRRQVEVSEYSPTQLAALESPHALSYNAKSSRTFLAVRLFVEHSVVSSYMVG